MASDVTIRAPAVPCSSLNSGTPRMTVAVAMAVRAAAVGVHAVGRQIDHLPMTHAALGDDVVGKFPHLGEIVTLVVVAREPLRRFALPSWQ
jgi:hypothetical protein